MGDMLQDPCAKAGEIATGRMNRHIAASYQQVTRRGVTKKIGHQMGCDVQQQSRNKRTRRRRDKIPSHPPAAPSLSCHPDIASKCHPHQPGTLEDGVILMMCSSGVPNLPAIFNHLNDCFPSKLFRYHFGSGFFAFSRHSSIST